MQYISDEKIFGSSSVGEPGRWEMFMFGHEIVTVPLASYCSMGVISMLRTFVCYCLFDFSIPLKLFPKQRSDVEKSFHPFASPPLIKQAFFFSNHLALSASLCPLLRERIDGGMLEGASTGVSGLGQKRYDRFCRATALVCTKYVL